MDNGTQAGAGEGATQSGAQAGQAAQAGAAAAQAGAAGSAGAGQGAGGNFWDTLPDNMKGATAEETLKKVMPSWQGYHKAHSEREPALAKIEDLKIEITNEKAKPFFNPQSPMAAAFSKAAVAAGLTKTVAGKLANEFMGAMAESGSLAKPINVNDIFLEQAKALGFAAMDDKAKAGLEQVHKELTGYADNLGEQLKLSDRAKTELASLLLTPGGFELVRAMRGQEGQDGFKLGGTGGGNPVLTKEEVFALNNDDRANPLSRKFDPAFRAKADQAMEELRARTKG